MDKQLRNTGDIKERNETEENVPKSVSLCVACCLYISPLHIHTCLSFSHSLTNSIVSPILCLYFPGVFPGACPQEMSPSPAGSKSRCYDDYCVHRK